MKVLDPGHDYLLDSYDGEREVRLTFVKRNFPPEKFPGNADSYAGTQMQDVLSALIDRCKYVNHQTIMTHGKFCPETDMTIALLRQAIWVLEARVKRVKGEAPLQFEGVVNRIEDIPVCHHCGHIFCSVDHQGANLK